MKVNKQGIKTSLLPNMAAPLSPALSVQQMPPPQSQELDRVFIFVISYIKPSEVKDFLKDR